MDGGRLRIKEGRNSMWSLNLKEYKRLKNRCGERENLHETWEGEGRTKKAMD